MTQVALRRPRAILFDWDNTLVDSWPLIHESMNVTLTAMGQPTWSRAECIERVQLSLRDRFPVLFGARWEEARQIYLDYFLAHHLERLTPLAQSADMLARLARHGLHLGIVSNKLGPTLRKEVAHLGWTGYFEEIVGAGDAPLDKPSAETVKRALRELTPSHEVWFVGDAPVDMECAHGAGCFSILIGEAADNPRFGRHLPHLCLADLDSLAGLLETGRLERGAGE